MKEKWEEPLSEGSTGADVEEILSLLGVFRYELPVRFSLGDLTMKIVLVLLATGYNIPISLPVLSAMIFTEAISFCCNSKGRVRRLYDAANILAGMGIIAKERMTVAGGKKVPSYKLLLNIDCLMCESPAVGDTVPSDTTSSFREETEDIVFSLREVELEPQNKTTNVTKPLDCKFLELVFEDEMLEPAAMVTIPSEEQVLDVSFEELRSGLNIATTATTPSVSKISNILSAQEVNAPQPTENTPDPEDDPEDDPVVPVMRLRRSSGTYVVGKQEDQRSAINCVPNKSQLNFLEVRVAPPGLQFMSNANSSNTISSMMPATVPVHSDSQREVEVELENDVLNGGNLVFDVDLFAMLIQYGIDDDHYNSLLRMLPSESSIVNHAQQEDDPNGMDLPESVLLPFVDYPFVPSDFF